jgi:photosystem II stability/assembly factor-like uncharacterized protein
MLAWMCAAAAILLPGSALSDGSWATMQSPVSYNLRSVSGTWDGDVYACGDNGTLIHYDGASWTRVQLPSPTYDLYAIICLASGEIFVAGENGIVLHRDEAGSWTYSYPGKPNTIRALWEPSASSATGIVACGDVGRLLRFDGSRWKSISSPTTLPLYCIWGGAADDFWTAGNLPGVLWHYVNDEWDSVNTSVITSQTFRALWGFGPDSVYAAGSDGKVLFYDGSFWYAVLTTDQMAVNALWGASDADVFAAGKYGVVYHYDGRAWWQIRLRGTVDVNAAWGGTSGKVHFVGNEGSIAVYTRDDTFAPSVIYSSPAGASTGVSTGSRIVFKFSEAVNKTNINDAIKITPEISWGLSGETSDNTVILTPSEPLDPLSTYAVTISSTGVADSSGNNLSKDYSISFTTGQQAEGGSGSSGGGCFISCCAMH